MAHLKETLEGKMEKMKRMEAEKAGTNQSEIKAVVHRAETPRETGREGGEEEDTQLGKPWTLTASSSITMSNKTQQLAKGDT